MKVFVWNSRDVQSPSLTSLTCLSFCSCFVIASLLRFWLLESSVLFESACFELAEPKQPIADQGAHQQADDVPSSGEVSGDSVVPRASPLRASININFQSVFLVLPHARFRTFVSSSTKNVVLLLLNVYFAILCVCYCTFLVSYFLVNYEYS